MSSGSFKAGRITLRECATGRAIATLYDGPANVSGSPRIRDLTGGPSGMLLGYSPDGQIIAIDRSGRPVHSIDFFDAHTGKKTKRSKRNRTS
jgi:hypothetical protein